MNIQLNTKNTSYIMEVLPSGHLSNLYYGARLREREDMSALRQKNNMPIGTMVAYSDENQEVGLDDQLLEYSGFGKGDFREPAFEVRFEDGACIGDLAYVSHRLYDGRENIEGLPCAAGECRTLEVETKDITGRIKVTLFYHVFYECDVITRWARIENISSGNVRLLRAMSAQLDIAGGDYSLATFDGTWAAERTRTLRSVNEQGIYTNDSKTGNSSARHNPFIMLERGGCTEQTGECYGFNLVYSGSHAEIAERTYFGKLRILTGINPFGFEYLLEGGKSFSTPEAVLSYSNRGRNGLSQSMHEFVREHIVRGEWQHKPRPVLVNNWEATLWHFDEQKVLAIAKEAAKLGAELFVLDDGWFGERDDDKRGLGDWTVNRKKLPHGLDGLAQRINKLGLEFGIWVEPEMVNRNSALYRAHPDWAIASPEVYASESRNQLVLDLANDEVCEYIVNSMTDVFSSGNISYVKWDMNRNISDNYSPSLPPERQGEFNYRYILGLYKILAELTKRFPKILFESCASGGNRFDLGMLCYMPQVWTSDNTDAMCRIGIQGGTSYGYPLSTMGAHVSASPNMQTLRHTTIESRFNTAAFGLLGYELDLTRLPEFDLKAIKAQIEFYKQHRELFQFGVFYRLNETIDKDKVVWLTVSKDGNEAAAGLFQKNAVPGRCHDILRLTGLDYDADYTVDGRHQFINIKLFGELINYVLPVKLKSDGLVKSVLESKFMFNMTDESYELGGDMLCEAGINLKPQFAGTGFDMDIRVLSDYGSRIYYIKKKA